MATKSAQLDTLHTPNAGLKTKPFALVQSAALGLNALLGAVIVAGSMPLLTAKLDADAGVTDTDYAATLNPVVANALTKFNALLVKLDADELVNGTNYASTLTATAATLYAKYVALLAKLDADTGVSATNHGATALLSADLAAFQVTPIDG